MIPSIDDRLDSVVRALQEVILPALPPDRPLAIEQAHLSLAQIGLIREQLDLAPLFERREAEATIRLAEDLLAGASGGASTTAAVGVLRSAVTDARLDSPEATRGATREIGAAVELLIDASLDDGGDVFRASSMRTVLSAGRASAMINRAWNLSAGFESSDSAITAIKLK